MTQSQHFESDASLMAMLSDAIGLLDEHHRSHGSAYQHNTDFANVDDGCKAQRWRVARDELIDQWNGYIEDGEWENV